MRPYKCSGGHTDSSKHERAHLGVSVHPWWKSIKNCSIWKKKIVSFRVPHPTPKLTEALEYWSVGQTQTNFLANPTNYEKGSKRSWFPVRATDITLLLMCSWFFFIIYVKEYPHGYAILSESSPEMTVGQVSLMVIQSFAHHGHYTHFV